ncbi:PigN-domain-containing protein [Fistulina hepatica ATCC 64428]|uniref:GPI ethanolamine phosphate transferase 1 n=1 Tax=Fistulina hepatica ATCC 64428 TaxID=1128425 RepID=A0A0D7AJU9_9AGAR|nr:PigN-domain-containing protein [Fistulina hepatica ATCC 64428]
MSLHVYSPLRLLAIGLLFHLIFIVSVFDCYFRSPVRHGMQQHVLPLAQAKRLVLIVADGLRADLLFQKNGFNLPQGPDIVAPHIRAIVENRGAFGVSHTRVPTESRPGHVAIIGGMYEDISAVTKGWKTNPIDFDSVFNQSRSTFSFGSPDILPMFDRGAVPGKVNTFMYHEDDEDFTKDATALDTWVMDQLSELFRNASFDDALNRQLRSDKVVFFMHLLGLDTTGHSYRPFSEEYMRNVQVVDSIVQRTEAAFAAFYGADADKTSYVFTADHGMSFIGNHGDGHPDCTRTPLVLWGAGIRGPLPDSVPESSHDAYSHSWELETLYRRDVEQADLAPLMATLLGINWPVNSAGVLPETDPDKPSFLLPLGGNETLARAALVNARVLLENYVVSHELKRRHTLFFKPFSALETGETRRDTMLQKTEHLISVGDYDAARRTARQLIELTVEGTRYLLTYERFLIRAIAIAAYTGWAAYAALYIWKPNLRSLVVDRVARTIFGLILVSHWAVFALQKSPWTYYVYVVFPCYFWHQFATLGGPSLADLRWDQLRVLPLALRIVSIVAVLLSMVAGYTHRTIWSIGFAVIGVIWPLVSWSTETCQKMGVYNLLWPLVCAVNGIFPLLDVNKTENLPAMWTGGLSHGSRIFTATATIKSSPSSLGLLIVASMVVTTASVRSLQAKLGLPLWSQVSGWLVLASSTLIPFLSPVFHNNPTIKTLMYFLGFGPAFVLLSISVEGLFYAAFAAMLLMWVEVESARRIVASVEEKVPSGTINGRTAISNHGVPLRYVFRWDDLRMSLFFLFFVQVGFFGTGNVASISSFYLAPVYRLIPVFNPFFMAALLIFKIVVPYVILSLTFAALNHRLGLPPFSLFTVALSVTSGMTLTFFFKVSDTGSWLEIGQSISFFCITSLLLLWSAGVCVAGEFLMADVFVTRSIPDSKKE